MNLLIHLLLPHLLSEFLVTISQLRFRPSVGSNYRPTMPSAGFCESITKPLDPASTRQIHRPPGVRRVTFLSHTRRIYDGSVPDDIGLCIFVSAYPPATASDAVRVTRAKSLPAPSFRQYLTIPPLVFGQEFRSSRPPEGLAPSKSHPGSLSLAG
jgi:hypothetical protein